jgi:uncharacterized membrane protein YqjE
MVDQTPIAPEDGAAEAPARAFTRHASGFARDVSTLADLQLKLFSSDLQETLSRMAVPLFLVVASSVMAAAALPLILVGFAFLIVYYADWAIAWSMLVIAVGTTLVAAITGAIAYRSLRRSVKALDRSKQELLRNVNWIKMVLRHPQGVPPEPVPPFYKS